MMLFSLGGIVVHATPGASNPVHLAPVAINPLLPACGGTGDECYTLLEPLPGFPESVGNNADIGGFVNTIFLIGIGIAGLLSVIMIILGGLEYMSESVFGKTEAKKHIGGAILGLILALGAFVLLNTINPDLLKIGF